MNKNNILNDIGSSLIEIIMSVGILSASVSYFLIQSNMSNKITENSIRNARALEATQSITSIIATISQENLLTIINAENNRGIPPGSFYQSNDHPWLKKWIELKPFVKHIQYKIEVYSHDQSTLISLNDYKDKIERFREYSKKITTLLTFKQKNKNDQTLQVEKWLLGE